MVANHHFARIDTMELKDQIFRKIGHQRAEKYLDQLKKLFSSQIGKFDFDKVCIQTIGKENVALHNRLIRSIAKNAFLATTPPKFRKVDGSLNVRVMNGYQRSCLQSLHGDSLPQSPRKNRTPVLRNRKCTDRPSPLGPLGKSPCSITGKSPSVITEEVALRVQEQKSAAELLSVGSKPPVPIVSVEDGEEGQSAYSPGIQSKEPVNADTRKTLWSGRGEEEQSAYSPGIQSKGPVTAPFGVSLYSGDTRKTLWSGRASADYGSLKTWQSSGYLPDTVTLTNCLEKRLQLEGLGVSMDAANLLNHGLDAYMKRLIGSCIGMTGSRGGENCARPKNQYISRMNGVTPSIYPQGPASAGMLDFPAAMETNPSILDGENCAHSKSLYVSRMNGVLPSIYPQRPASSESMMSFRVAMETNPSILGEDWPMQLEKVCFRTSEQ